MSCAEAPQLVVRFAMDDPIGRLLAQRPALSRSVGAAPWFRE